MDEVLAVMRTLRAARGCPWDREQTHASLKQHLIEECYEVVEAIEQGDPRHLREELGDVLLQIVFHAQIAAEAGAFTFDDVARALRDKLVRRHPHVFGATRVSGSKEVLKNWEGIKRREHGAGAPRSVVAGIPRHLPALLQAEQVQRKVARVGFDWPAVAPVADKVAEELAEVRQALAAGRTDRVREEIGDLLFAVVNLGRFLGHSAEEALTGTVRKFVRRFTAIERRLQRRGRDVTACSLAELDALWEQVKAAERRARRRLAPAATKRRRPTRRPISRK